jgi:hypothetical protein
LTVPVTFVLEQVVGIIEVVLGGATKLAVTLCAELKANVHVEFVPELAHAPPHPPNVDGPPLGAEGLGVAVKVTIAPGA